VNDDGSGIVVWYNQQLQQIMIASDNGWRREEGNAVLLMKGRI